VCIVPEKQAGVALLLILSYFWRFKMIQDDLVRVSDIDIIETFI